MRYSRALGATPYISTLETKPSPYIPQQTIVVRISLLVGDWTGGRVGIGFSWTRKGWNWVQGVWPGMNWKRHEESFSWFGRLNAFPFAWFPGSTRLLTPTRPGGSVVLFADIALRSWQRTCVAELARSAPIVFEAGRRISASEYPHVCWSRIIRAVLPIPGTRTRGRLMENAAATSVTLTTEDMRILEPRAAAVQGIAVRRQIDARSWPRVEAVRNERMLWADGNPEYVCADRGRVRLTHASVSNTELGTGGLRVDVKQHCSPPAEPISAVKAWIDQSVMDARPAPYAKIDRGRMARKNRDDVASWDVEPELVLCPLCERVIPDDQRDAHHLVPKSRGGKKTVCLHHVCHDQIHAIFTDAQLAKKFSTIEAILEDPAVQKFVSWVKGKHPGFSDSAKESRQASSSRRGRKP